jgi:hypothetical protein
MNLQLYNILIDQQTNYLDIKIGQSLNIKR